MTTLKNIADMKAFFQSLTSAPSQCRTGPVMNILSRDKQIAIISALTEGLGIRATARVTDTDRGAVANLALRVGRGCATLHDGKMVGVRSGRLELDELWAFVQRKRRWHQKPGADSPVTGDQYTYVAL